MASPVIASSSVNKTGNQSGDLVFTTSSDGPSGIVDGDLLLAHITAVSAVIPTIGAPGGWTLIQTGAVDGGVAVRTSVFAKIASSEPVSYTFTGDGGATDGIVGKIVRITGHNAVLALVDLLPVTNPVTATSVTSINVPALALEEVDGLGFYFTGAGHSSSKTMTGPFQTTERWDFATDPGQAATQSAYTRAGGPLVGLLIAATITVGSSVDSLAGFGLIVRSNNPRPSPSIPTMGDAVLGNLSTDVTLPVPAGITNGEVMLSGVAAADATPPTLDVPSGWVSRASGGIDGGIAVSMLLASRVAASEPADYLFTGTPNVATDGMVGRILRLFEAESPPHAIGSVATDTSSDNLVVPGVTTTVDNCLVLYFVFNADSVAGGIDHSGFPSTLHFLWSTLHDPGQAVLAAVGAKVQETAGTTSDETFNFAAAVDSLAGVAIAFSPSLADELAGTVEGVGTLQGMLSATRPMAGTVEGVGNVEGALSATRPMVAEVTGAGTLEAALELAGFKELAGLIGGAGTIEASLGLTLALIGTVKGIGQLEAALEVQLAQFVLPELGSLGCGVWEAYISSRGGATKVVALPRASLSMGRELDDVSQASARIELAVAQLAGCCQLLADVFPWEHELQLMRDGQEVWAGPVTATSFSPNSIVVEASDLFVWFERRLLDEGFDMEDDLAAIFEQTVKAALRRDESPNVSISTADTGVFGRRIVENDGLQRAADLLRELSRTAVDFTVVGRQILVGGTDLAVGVPLVLTEEDFEDNVTVSFPGMDLASEVKVYGASSELAQTAGGVNPTVGLVQLVEQEPDIEDNASLFAAAEGRLELLSDRPFAVSGTLKPSASVPFRALVPGSRFDLRLTLGCLTFWRDARLHSVSVDVDDDGSEQISVDFAPLGSVG